MAYLQLLKVPNESENCRTINDDDKNPPPRVETNANNVIQSDNEETKLAIENIPQIEEHQSTQQVPPKSVRVSPMINTVKSVESVQANSSARSSYAVQTWKRWATRNSKVEDENSSMREKIVEIGLIGLTADELNSSLCLFMEEAHKSNDNKYRPDAIYYILFGIQ